ncbi:MAG TPA: hypothetical protein VG713_15905, partial [Pirellulales bacterium]|nr:hypothetical protein [Pirellulales bacterium]
PNANLETMFELPRYVIKSGEVLVEQGEIRATPTGGTLHVTPEYDRDVETDIAEWFNKYYTIGFANYPVQ